MSHTVPSVWPLNNHLLTSWDQKIKFKLYCVGFSIALRQHYAISNCSDDIHTPTIIKIFLNNMPLKRNHVSYPFNSVFRLFNDKRKEPVLFCTHKYWLQNCYSQHLCADTGYVYLETSKTISFVKLCILSQIRKYVYTIGINDIFVWIFITSSLQ